MSLRSIYCNIDTSCQSSKRYHIYLLPPLKAEIRESWLMDMMQILDEKMVCNNAAQAEAAIKKHEAISAEILARVSCLLYLAIQMPI